MLDKIRKDKIIIWNWTSVRKNRNLNKNLIEKFHATEYRNLICLLLMKKFANWTISLFIIMHRFDTKDKFRMEKWGTDGLIFGNFIKI